MNAGTKFSLIYFTIAAIHLLAILLQNHTGILLTKPLILLSLILSYGIQTKLKGSFHQLIALGLVLGWIGDLFLLFEEQYFMYGLAAFLGGHILYTLAFCLDINRSDFFKQGKTYLISILILAYAILYVQLLNPFLGELQIPVMIYILAIGIFYITASARGKITPKASYTWIVLGALLFVLSDSILAYNKFVENIQYGQLWTMLTYILAQYFIAQGAVLRVDKKRENN